MKTVKENFDRAVYMKSSYWNHAHKHGRYSPDGTFEEPLRANPNYLDETMDMYSVQAADKEVQARVEKLLKLAKQILTEMQYKAFVLLAVKDPALTEREAAKVLSISRGRVHQLWTIAREKLQAAYEGRTHEDSI